MFTVHKLDDYSGEGGASVRYQQGIIAELKKVCGWLLEDSNVVF